MGCLYIVPTPIGNLKDITLRALEVLNQVDIIACENTKHSQILLSHYGIKTRTMSYHKFNENISQDKILTLLNEGKNIALISDAGMPLISDPGYVLLKELEKRNIPFTVLPGASASICAMVMSGFDTQQFLFFGFLKGRLNEKIEALTKLKNIEVPIIFYIAPHDLEKDLKLIFSVFGKRNSKIINEISKLYEKNLPYVLGEDISFEPKGEYVVVIDGKIQNNNLSELSIEEHINHYIEMGLEKREAIKLVAKDRNLAKNEVYKHTYTT